MSRFDNGWFKFYRRAFYEDIGRNQTCLALWSALLSMATYMETKLPWKGEQKILPPGSVVFGAGELAEKWGVSKSTIWRWLRYLESSERIRVETDTAGTIVTILNWTQYQTREELDETLAEQKRSHSDTVAIQQRALTEEGKKERKKEETSFDFEILYSKYPRKEGKQLGLSKCKRQIKSQSRYDALARAITNYAHKCAVERTAKEYIKKFSNFMNEWEDFTGDAVQVAIDPKLLEAKRLEDQIIREAKQKKEDLINGKLAV